LRRSPREKGRRWLEQAQEDLRWAEDLAHRGGGDHVACFLAQQVGGKALKGLLFAAGEELVLGHSVERLCHEAGRFHPELLERVRRWALLDGFYVTTRYPNTVPDTIPARVFTEGAAREGVELAAEIVRFGAERLEGAA
jgi:HEPN domain-containing protein